MSVSDPPLTLDRLGALDVGLVGVGREGRATWARFVERHPGRPLTLYTEHAPEPAFIEQLRPGLDRLVCGPMPSRELCRHDILVRSPGVSPYRGALGEAVAAGSRTTSASSLWFAEHGGDRVIAVTGTKGKSTTTALVATLLRAAGHAVTMAGNIGRPLFDLDPGHDGWVVLELSSYQLCDLEGAPAYGVLLNLSDEHLDWHGGAARYRADKLRLAGLVRPGGLVANGADTALRAALAGHDDVHWFNVDHADRVGQAGVELLGGGLLQPTAALPGRHNLANLAAAVAVTRLAGVPPPDPQSALESFQGLPHRLQRLGESGDGLAFVDDSLSTTPVATLAALQALAGQAVTLLVGGLDRGLDWRPFVAPIAETAPHAVIGLPDSGEQLVELLVAGGLQCPGGLHVSRDMADALDIARAVSRRPGLVVLSPGAPSFPRYRDYIERAEDFARHAGLVLPA
ncbi:UDP-N-acetylmuramoyl-L-alanine--D-glutamate ligase [Marinihelvus fidelis]|uniref:UDP-N-acetylmuramoyl-L-alanine--D-glutamate ligase n=1 Tax=Marinihelvus fidelis TaxID=2613842 RepID=UPI0017841AEA|nr:UDP-N-acetylmuramoyl-L-alanine--D-glutamate ligase [Marinihelvus fidelis]